MAGLYVVLYNGAMLKVLLPCDFSADRLSMLPPITLFLWTMDSVWFLVPVAALGAGLWARQRNRPVLFELSVGGAWLLALAWILLAHLAWLLPLLPLCSPVQ